MKLGAHCQVWDTTALEWCLRIGGPIVKTMSADPEPIRRILEKHPNTAIVVRTYFDDGEQRRLLDAGYGGGVACANLVLGQFADIRQLTDRVIVEGLNEVGLWEDADRYNDFTIGFSDQCRISSVRPAVYSFATGNPPGYKDGAPGDLRAYWAHYVGGLRAARAADGLLTLHEYDVPMQRLASWLCLRYRRVIEALPDDLKDMPILISECGIDGGVIGASSAAAAGWTNYATADEYLAQLRWYDAELAKDPQVIGATIFTVGGDGMWSSFDLKDQPQIADALAVSSPSIEEPKGAPMDITLQLDALPTFHPNSVATITGQVGGIPTGAGGGVTILANVPRDGESAWIGNDSTVVAIGADGRFAATISFGAPYYPITAPVGVQIEATAIVLSPPMDVGHARIVVTGTLEPESHAAAPSVAMSALEAARETVFRAAGDGFNADGSPIWLDIQAAVNAMKQGKSSFRSGQRR